MARRETTRYLFITLASLFFYGWWDWRFVFLLVGTGLIDFFFGLAIESSPRNKKAILVTSVIINLSTLGFFKYQGFFVENMNSLFSFTGEGYRFPIWEIILPVGVSFYTFQSMSYTIDIYRGHLKATRNILHFFASLTLFPHLLAGPILRASFIQPQLKTWTPPDNQKKWDGLYLIVHGFFKKIFIADNLAPAINQAFASSPGEHSTYYWWCVVTMFAIQIYCDFSGYTDIARGLTKWMGYELPLNFNHPYTATSMKDFWKRWHISLSEWFRDYVYIPLGGSHASGGKTIFYLWVTFILSGFWHGAAWNFIAWGALHALFLTIERFTRWPERLRKFPMGGFMCCLLVLVQVWAGWAVFRAESLPQALEILSRMFWPQGGIEAWSFSANRDLLTVIVLGMLIREIYVAGWREKVNQRFQGMYFWAEPVFLGMAAAAAIFLRGPGNAFIYFQF